MKHFQLVRVGAFLAKQVPEQSREIDHSSIYSLDAINLGLKKTKGALY
jgi:hypothetical protein